MDGTTLLVWLIVGALAGWLASIFMKTNGRQGLIQNIVIGVIGGLIGGFLFNQFGASGVTGFNVSSIFVAFVGAVILLAVMRMVSSRGLLS